MEKEFVVTYITKKDVSMAIQDKMNCSEEYADKLSDSIPDDELRRIASELGELYVCYGRYWDDLEQCLMDRGLMRRETLV